MGLRTEMRVMLIAEATARAAQSVRIVVSVQTVPAKSVQRVCVKHRLAAILYRMVVRAVLIVVVTVPHVVREKLV